MGFSLSAVSRGSCRADLYSQALATSHCQFSWIFNGDGNRHGIISDGE